MCDCYPGSVLISIRRGDDFAPRALERTFRSSDITTLDEAAGRDLGELSLPHYYLQVNVPTGNEQVSAEAFRRNYIESALESGAGPDVLRQWLLRADFAPIAQPEAIATSSGTFTPGMTRPFTFTVDHQRYRNLLNIPRAAPGTIAFTPIVGVIDSGWQATPTLSPAVISERDLTASPVGNVAPDTIGHGSVVLGTIYDLAPGASFRVYRVSTGKDCREWTFLAGLASAADDRCDIVNASIGFGLTDRNCQACGRDFGTTRSQVFHRLLGSLLANNDGLLYVGAAGNQGLSRACYPARFAEAICVASTDSSGSLSTRSNWGNYDQDDSPHPCLVLAPGGDWAQANLGSNEYVASYQGASWRGTSFAAAYVTGLLAEYLSRAGSKTRAALIGALTANASTAKVAGYSRSEHGAGLAQRL